MATDTDGVLEKRVLNVTVEVAVLVFEIVGALCGRSVTRPIKPAKMDQL